MPNRSHQPTEQTRKQVKALAAFGIPQIDICKVIGISKPTLEKHYREELDTGAVEATAKVAQNLYNKATGEGREAVTAAIFWLKTRAGWKETMSHELTGKDGAPLIRADQLAESLIAHVSGKPSSE